MKIFFLLLFLLLFENIIYSQKTTIKISNPSRKLYVLYDYLTHDSLFSSSLLIDSLIVENEDHFRTLLLFVNNVPSFNIIVLDKNDLELRINEKEKLEYSTETINKSYLTFQKQLSLLKNKKASQEIINNFIFNFFYKNSNILTALEYAHSSILYNIYSKDSCRILFDNLDSKLKKYELWDKTEKLLTTNITTLKTGDVVPGFEIITPTLQKAILPISQKPTITIFWASWCLPCKKELSFIKSNIDSFKQFEFRLINLDKDTKNWLSAVNSLKLGSFKNYHLEDDFEDELALVLKINGIPHNLITDNKNKILHLKTDLVKSKEISFNLFYDSGKFNIVNNHKKTILSALSNIPLQDIIEIKLTGHADSLGNQKANYLLSANRVKKVKEFLTVQFNLDSNIITNNYSGERNSKNLQNDRQVEGFATYHAPLLPVLDSSTKKTIIYRNILFESGKDIFLPSSSPDLRKLKAFMLNNKGTKIEIQGHVCCAPKGQYYDLSNRRAKKVYDFLVKNGINTNRMTFKGFGSDRPLPNNTDESLNRRVEILILE